MRHSVRYRIGDRPRTTRNLASSDDRDTAARDARSATVQGRSGKRWINASAGAKAGSRRPDNHPASTVGAVERCTRRTSISTSSGNRVEIRLVLRFEGANSSIVYVMLACTHPAAGPSGKRTTNTD